MTKKTVSPPTWKSIIVKWLGIFPSVLLLSYSLKWLGVKPMLLKLFIETIILVPMLTYVVTPLMKTLFSDWLYKGMDVKEEDRETVDIGS
ncbi:hypothetical protein NBT05_10855 [Aquimarina sp. ERC-38]|uniref:hypothetical protein n=1 Tax=Aquimarina sp. ERC-38 TaxID=2949996 RepID=UPI00224592D5|nr:hypothetical protein [Aquimarina sp. ERC-38]UZO79458.1 hypothetical protein NBT05_10855 [Aquimarina sp. ERC-38]